LQRSQKNRHVTPQVNLALCLKKETPSKVQMQKSKKFVRFDDGGFNNKPRYTKVHWFK